MATAPEPQPPQAGGLPGVPPSNSELPKSSRELTPGQWNRAVRYGKKLLAVGAIGLSAAAVAAYTKTGEDKPVKSGGAVATNTTAANKTPAPQAETESKQYKKDFEFTKKIFESWISPENKSYPVAFNGVAVLDGTVKLSMFIDPEGKGLHPNTLGGEVGDIEHQFLPMNRPIMQYDDRGQLWLGATGASTLNDAESDTYSLTVSGKRYIRNQATTANLNSWGWVRYDPKHIKLYQYTSNLDSPGGKYPLVGLGVPDADHNSEQYQYLLETGTAGNFVSAVIPGIPSESIAAWGAHDIGTDAEGKTFTIGGKHVPRDQVDAYLAVQHVKPYDLPNSQGEVEKLMKASFQPQEEYKGTD